MVLRPETVQKVVNRAERDICVVADPRGSDQHDGDQEERDDEQNPLFRPQVARRCDDRPQESP